MSDRRPRILLGVTSDVSLTLMQGLPEYLRDTGWDVHVVSSTGPLLTSLAESADITVHPVAMRRNPAPLADLASVAAWIRVLRKVRPDVTLIGTPKAGFVGGLAALLTRVPRRIYHLRGLRLETTSGFSRRIYALLERLSARAAHSVLAVSASLRDRYLELRLAPARKVIVLGRGSSNGVDLARFDPSAVSAARVRELRAALGLQEGVPVIGFVGRLNADKGLASLNTALEELVKRGIRHQLLVVGGIDGSLNNGLGDEGTIQTGHVPDTRDFYCLLDILCLPTLREGFPNVVLEAAAMGVPSVTTRATGAVDSVVAGQTGWLTPVNDALSLADALEEALADPARRHAFGRNARQFVETNFAQPDVWRSLTEYLRQAG